MNFTSWRIIHKNFYKKQNFEWNDDDYVEFFTKIISIRKTLLLLLLRNLCSYKNIFPKFQRIKREKI